jgi:spore germination protein YaaH
MIGGSMKTIILTLLFTIMFYSCSSTKNQSSSIGNLAEEDKMIGDELPDWVDFEGTKSGKIYAIGEAEFSTSKKESLVKRAAQHNAKMRIVSRMPTDYKQVVQNSLSSASDGEFNTFELSSGALDGLTTVSVSRKYTTCRKIIRNTGADKKVNRICYSRAEVPLKDFNKAVERTIKRKYGEKIEKKFSEIMDQKVREELNK